ncbi:MAG TPA: hypothetical protein VLW17_00775 [Thermoanaerobaculaceae bacterium]|nr:hypothetical protein [Thermoanaerobaculaceae bacterium]
MPGEGDLQRWRELLRRLQAGPAPRGAEFDLCRRVLAAAPAAPEAREAARLLLEAAMADAATPIADAQEVMRLLRAVSRGAVDLLALVGAT